MTAVSSERVRPLNRTALFVLGPGGGFSEGGSGLTSTSSRSNASCSPAMLPEGRLCPCCRTGGPRRPC
eukprot:11681198-Alexandrium_andersonii.AAC.1